MKNAALLLILPVLLTACKKKNRLGDIKLQYAYEIAANYVNNAYIIKDSTHPQYPYTIAKRTGCTVFHYSVAKVLVNGNDDNYFTGLAFQADSGVSTFSYKDSVLGQKLTNYHSDDEPMTLLNKGTISGTRQPDNSWIVDIHVLLPSFDSKIRMYRFDTTVHITEGHYLQ